MFGGVGTITYSVETGGDWRMVGGWGELKGDGNRRGDKEGLGEGER